MTYKIHKKYTNFISSKNIVDIYGEDHTTEERYKINSEIIENHKNKPYDFLLLEELGEHIYLNNKEIEDAITNEMYSNGPLGLELALKLNIPAIGIDLWSDDVYKDDIKDDNGMAIDCTRSFFLRETKMVNTIEEYRTKGNCAVILGDAHLRKSITPELGNSSLVYQKYNDDSNVTIYRSENGEID